jgi:hypothetical protein
MMMSLADPLYVTQLVTDVFESLDIPYAVGGSLASSLHGIPRATQDVDIVADLQLHQVMPLVTALEQTFYVDADMIRAAIARRSSFNIIHLATMFKVDVFVLPLNTPFQEEITRRERLQLSTEVPASFFVVMAEDIILHKLHWFQLGGGVSERQWRDVLGVLQVQRNTLDYNYLQTVAAQCGVSELLAQVFKEAGINR